MTKPAPKIYVIADADTDLASLLFSAEESPFPKEFDSVEDGIQFLKDNDFAGVVVTVSARVTPEARFKVERWK